MDGETKDIASVFVEKYGITAEEAEEYISRAVNAAGTGIELLVEAVRKIFGALRDIWDVVSEETEAIAAYQTGTERERKEAWRRARRIEREYRALICRCERQRFVRKVWRPPR